MEETKRQWGEYLDAESVGIRQITMEKLQDFIAAFLSLSDDERTVWVYSFLAENVKRTGIDFPLRMPMFREIVFPELLRGVLAASPGAARFLGHLSQYLYKNKDLTEQLPEELQNSYGLYKAAIQHDPTDVDARTALAEKHFSWLTYTLHELPWGVLVDTDGVTLDRMHELEEQLEEFRGLLDVVDDAKASADLIVACEFHYREYAVYLRNTTEWSSYQQYLVVVHSDNWPDC